jgi:D-glycero-D-manno-heptose 1,7-bisphosphate phosphatase
VMCNREQKITKEKQKFPAIFLDRDGTLIEDVGYIKEPSAVSFFPNTFADLIRLQEHFMLFIITNQSGIGNNLLTDKEVKIVNSYIETELKKQGITITATYYCPHTTEDNCFCKKPSPYFINQAVHEYNIDRKHSYIIGDHPSDSECGIRAGLTPIYVLTGHGNKHKNELTCEVAICKSLSHATERILNNIYYDNKII